MAQKAIGPNFGNELAAYGAAHNLAILGAHFAWHGDGTLEFFDDTPQAVKDAAAAVYAAHDPAAPDPRAAFAATLAGGCAIQSTATPALNATYAIDAPAQQTIAGVATGIAARSRVPGGGASFNYPDASGQLHAFTAADFLNLAAAIEDYVYALSNGEAPAQPVVIA
jgi:hypothetical protein